MPRQAATTPAALAALGAQGFARLVLQIGASPEPQPRTGGSAADSNAQQSSSPSSSSSTPRRRSRRLSAEGGQEGQHGGLAVEWYRYKDSLRADMEGADLIISHAGGCVLHGWVVGIGTLACHPHTAFSRST